MHNHDGEHDWTGAPGLLAARLRAGGARFGGFVRGRAGAGAAGARADRGMALGPFYPLQPAWPRTTPT